MVLAGIHFRALGGGGLSVHIVLNARYTPADLSIFGEFPTKKGQS